MARQKGTPKTGGRKKGTPNKSTAAVKDYIADVLHRYMQPPAADSTAPNLERDLENMQPEDRVRAMTQLAGYVVPKQQALTIDEQTQMEEDALTRWIEEAPDEAVDAIAARVLEMNRRNTPSSPSTS